MVVNTPDLLPHVLHSAHTFASRPSGEQMRLLAERLQMSPMFSESAPLG